MLTLLLCVTICFSSSAFLLSSDSLTLNGSYIKPKQKDDAFGQRESLGKMQKEEKKQSRTETDRQRDGETVKIRH